MDIPGLPARRAALRLIDAVLHRGETLDQAGPGALQGIRGDADRALARAIAGEALRWLIDLDALIDSATNQILPHDAKPRSVLNKPIPARSNALSPAWSHSHGFR